ncbi:MAG TPA: hypothetical protein DDZ51_06250 [Planctomycetaceae bacterium]|nr:hypothetical protein [Planctomycetaceae bacterium]
MLIDRSSWRMHAVAITLAMILFLGLTAWYLAESWLAGRLLGGGSLPGLVLGSVAAMIIFFEMGLWPRKALRRMRLVRVKYWLSAHIWFGIVCLPIAIVHSGFHWGGWLSTLLILALVLTVASGAIGLALQNMIPRMLLKQVPGETIYGEIENISRSIVLEADQLLNATCGTRDAVMTQQLGIGEMTRFRELLGSDPEVQMTRMIVIGAPREAGRRREGYQESRAATAEQDDSRSLWNAYDELKPFLLDGVTSGRVFGDPIRASGWFGMLRQACSADAERVIGPLERLTDQRRQFSLQKRLHHWLHMWLPYHIGLSVGLCVLLLAHIVFALRYW